MTQDRKDGLSTDGWSCIDGFDQITDNRSLKRKRSGR